VTLPTARRRRGPLDSRARRVARLSGRLRTGLIGAVVTAAAAGLSAGELRELRALAAGALVELDAPGLSAAVVRDDRLLWAGGFGLADVENRVPARADTVYRIASLSKPITATAVLQLAERGLVDLDAPVQRWVPAFPEKRAPVSLRQILTHTSGIRHYRSGEFIQRRRYRDVVAALAIFKDDPLLFEPGTRYEYSSHAYNLLAAVVECASGLGFGEYLRERVFEPAGMNDTHLDRAERLVDRRARQYERSGVPGRWRNAPAADLSSKWAAGGMLSSALDLARFHVALDRGVLLRPETLGLMHAEHRLDDGTPTGYGLGWAVARDARERLLVGHAGGTTGGSAFLLRVPGTGEAVALLVNVSDAGDLYPLAQRLLAAARGEAGPEPVEN
jgi:CubicO group peptidase (beta-lactamase class C family)